jgi:hypothetical protein
MRDRIIKMMKKNIKIKLTQVVVLCCFVFLTTVVHGNNFNIEKNVNRLTLGHADPNGIGFYVSPGGNDGGRGGEKQPFRTINRAVQAVRDWRRCGHSFTMMQGIKMQLLLIFFFIWRCRIWRHL